MVFEEFQGSESLNGITDNTASDIPPEGLFVKHIETIVGGTDVPVKVHSQKLSSFLKDFFWTAGQDVALMPKKPFHLFPLFKSGEPQGISRHQLALDIPFFHGQILFEISLPGSSQPADSLIKVQRSLEAVHKRLHQFSRAKSSLVDKDHTIVLYDLMPGNALNGTKVKPAQLVFQSHQLIKLRDMVDCDHMPHKKLIHTCFHVKKGLDWFVSTLLLEELVGHQGIEPRMNHSGKRTMSSFPMAEYQFSEKLAFPA
jgi:hypothetical protein